MFVLASCWPDGQHGPVDLMQMIRYSLKVVIDYGIRVQEELLHNKIK